ncbi:M28 family peptidase [Hyperthermus butylicus]|uniref:Conserved archaeal protein n=1 Tax=Hyperthermus butylicus (strain DSM 5456 / JCM 9403 / PLM1-5) TaxID=415426 RepID=A2BM00_HYPBU|nr:M28 family peptidase [Hyperthermus butylicus]ABM81011.1 conserved archaeal protein [Hyperthermus butylicus DSM 5456]
MAVDLFSDVLKLVDGLRGFELVASLARFHRVQGGDDIVVAVEHVGQVLEELGVEVRLEVFRGPLGLGEFWGFGEPRGWRLGGGRVEVWEDVGGWKTVASVEDTPLTVVVHSPPGSVEERVRLAAEPADAGEDDIVVSPEFDAYKYYRFAERGVTGIIGTHRGPGVRYWGLFPAFFIEEPRVPAVSLEYNTAMNLVGKRVRITVESEYHGFPSTPILVARVGPEGAPCIALYAHACHPRPGAHDNASGVAVLVEALYALKELLGRDSWFSVCGIVVPEYTGSMAVFAQHIVDPQEVVAAVSVDMVAADLAATGGSLHLVASPLPLASPLDPLLDVFLGHVEGYAGFEFYSVGSDHDVTISLGIPGSMVNEWPDRYYHTSLDEPGNLSAERLRATAAAIAAAVAALARLGPEKAAKLAGLWARHQASKLSARAYAGEPLDMTAAAELEKLAVEHASTRIKALASGGQPEPPWPFEFELSLRAPMSKLYLYAHRHVEAYRELLKALEDDREKVLQRLLVLGSGTASRRVVELYARGVLGLKHAEKKADLVVKALTAKPQQRAASGKHEG